MTINTDKKVHSEIGASSMDRWSKCPGSVALSRDLPNHSNFAAAEGTLCHTLGERWLTVGEDPRLKFGQTFEVEGFKILVTEEMIAAVYGYGAAVHYPAQVGDKMYIEHSFDLSAIYPGLFGTADHVRWIEREKRLVVTDLKYGAGIGVEVENNPQLLYYALGALLTLKHNAETVTIRIYQPRFDHPNGAIREWTIPATQLLDYAADLKEYAIETTKPTAAIVSGEHCRFCRAAAADRCPVLKREKTELVAMAFSPLKSYDPAELARGLSLADSLEGQIKHMREFAYSEAMAGRVPPGWKLVEKRKHRSWKNAAEAAQFLELAGADEDAIFTPRELKSPAQVEGVMGKQFKKILAPLVDAKSSGLTLVIGADSRQAYIEDMSSHFTVVKSS